jgi:hypothetical protein
MNTDRVFSRDRYAVLAIHKPEVYRFLDGRRVTFCRTCNDPETSRSEPWPCPTARAVGVPCCDLHTATCGDADPCCDNCPTINEGAPA